ncbi:response regulator [Gilvimarinus sp. SDUM040013]|uniref:Response regulator n=1 Tax=Gilvimarinus gilvus TaxID=3058038 RepID=A0ABU4RWP8_9GAMM|nr:response regulator [Gilvimarinus sp. SDUM040013]MDO3388537.1 response regulator [Gilvimarinus sp. SDUM040013]MDX6848591.1 response regulator [Gilvimarinus sp. SDUM040013]
MKASLKVLVVDDSEDDREQYRERLTEDEQRSWLITEAEDGRTAIDLVKNRSFDCILLDYSLPGRDGLEILKRLRESNIKVPIIMLTGQGNEKIAVEAMKLGAQDYLPKSNIDTAIITGSIVQAIERKSEEIELFRRANYDHLTGLASRSLLDDRLLRAVDLCTRNKSAFALIYLDLDRFKQVNDTYGHDCGDELLIEAARRLQNTVRAADKAMYECKRNTTLKFMLFE